MKKKKKSQHVESIVVMYYKVHGTARLLLQHGIAWHVFKSTTLQSTAVQQRSNIDKFRCTAAEYIIPLYHAIRVRRDGHNKQSNINNFEP